MPNNGGELMGKLRVYELAKELGLESKAVINWLANMGIEVKNHMSTLEDDLVTKLRERAKGGGKDKGKDIATRDKAAAPKSEHNHTQDRRPAGQPGQGQGQSQGRWQDRRPAEQQSQWQGQSPGRSPDQRPAKKPGQGHVP